MSMRFLGPEVESGMGCAKLVEKEEKRTRTVKIRKKYLFMVQVVVGSCGGCGESI